jgi:cyclophilin family peptidyl-prolyl cis-trans isomerase/HEAT repeat protein
LNLMMLLNVQHKKRLSDFFTGSILVSGALLFSACQQDSPNKFSDPILISIAQLQDRRASDSLKLYLNSDQTIYRKAAALAFASVQDSSISIDLGNVLLEDPDDEVRRNAAFALGQTGGFQSVNALIGGLEYKNNLVVREVLEALGKSVKSNDLSVLIDFKPKDSITEEGLAWALYRVGLRGLADSLVIKREAEFLDSKYSDQTRLAAAHFFSRSRISGGGFDENLARAATQDSNVDVRMAATNGVSKLSSKDKALQVAEKILKEEKDYRVRVGAVRAVGRISLNDIVFAALKDPSTAVQVAASEVILGAIKDQPFKRLEQDIREAKNFRVKANLYAALLRSVPHDNAIEEIISLYKDADVYSRAHLISALGYAQDKNSEKAISFLANELINSREFVVKSSAAQALTTINRNISVSTEAQKQFAAIYEDAILNGDPAVIGIISSALSDEKLNYKAVITDFSFLQTAKNKLSLPKDYESLQPLEVALAYFEGREKPQPPKNEYNHPMNWNLVKSISKNQKVLIKTTKGDVVLQMLVEEAPGSVANFIDLVNKKYFDGRYVHRVVPNFVVQAGCNRGDGFGGEDYSIRSEFSMSRHKTGSVGMASAGKDTEGTQWFITHSPTPHLDGGYTIFAETVSGMNTVDLIEVGDKIISATLVSDNK